MVSVTMRRNDLSLVPVDRWTDDKVIIARHAAKLGLANVGEIRSDFEEFGEYAFAVRRLCTMLERRHVQEDFLDSNWIKESIKF